MGFFNRRTRPADANTANAVAEGPDTTREKTGRQGIMRKNERHPATARAEYGNGHLNTRPRFGQWLKATWPDLLTMVIMGAIGLGVGLLTFSRKREGSVSRVSMESGALTGTYMY